MPGSFFAWLFRRNANLLSGVDSCRDVYGHSHVLVHAPVAAYTAASFASRVQPMRVNVPVLSGILLFALAPGVAYAVDCTSRIVPQPLPDRADRLVTIAPELFPLNSQLGASAGVLSQALKEAQSVDRVLLRLRIEGCQNVAKAFPAPSPLDPYDPATYKPKTEFDNSPWRFDMTQNGKRMTADEFSAWMKLRGVRVARGANAPAPVAPAGMPPGVTPPPAEPPPRPF